MAPAVARAPAGDREHAGVLEVVVALVDAVDGQSGLIGDLAAGDFRGDAVLALALRGAELEQDDEQPELA
jgi:hypothetical protein